MRRHESETEMKANPDDVRRERAPRQGGRETKAKRPAPTGKGGQDQKNDHVKGSAAVRGFPNTKRADKAQRGRRKEVAEGNVRTPPGRLPNARNRKEKKKVFLILN